MKNKRLTEPFPSQALQFGENWPRSDALRRAEAFPVQGGDILPPERKSWFDTAERRAPRVQEAR